MSCNPDTKTMNQPAEWPMGALSPSKREGAKHFVQQPLHFAHPDRFCNAAMPAAKPGEITRLMTAAVRPGSDHRHPSRGTGC